MKLDLTHKQRYTLESALDVIADLINSLRERKDNLLDKGYGIGSSHVEYLNERVFELQVGITALNTCKHSIKNLID